MVGAHQPGRGRAQRAAGPAFDVRVLEQGRAWVDRDGTRRSLSGMTLPELEDVISFLRTHRDVLYLLVLRREVGLRLLAVSAGHNEQMPRTSPERDDQDDPAATTPVAPTSATTAATAAASRGEEPTRAPAIGSYTPPLLGAVLARITGTVDATTCGPRSVKGQTGGSKPPR